MFDKVENRKKSNKWGKYESIQSLFRHTQQEKVIYVTRESIMKQQNDDVMIKTEKKTNCNTVVK